MVDNYENQKFCQSCAMPLTDELFATNADGSKNEDYCMYCLKITACTVLRMGNSLQTCPWKK